MKNGFINIAIGALIVGAVLIGAGLTKLYDWQTAKLPLGATIPTPAAVFETSLSSKLLTTDTSMTMVASSTKAGTALNAYMCFTIDGGKTNEEFVCGTATSSSVTGLLRGVDQLNPNTTSSALTKEHRAGANVKITDWPYLGILGRLLNGQDTLPNPLEYDASITNATLSGNMARLVNYNLLASTSFSGTVPITWTIPGIAMLATTSALTVGTATTSYGGSNYRLIVPNQFFNQTSSASNIVPVTNSSGKLSQGFIDTAGNYAWSATNTWSASSTFSGVANFSGTTNITGQAIMATATALHLEVSGTSTFSTTTFTSIPFLPTATATENYQIPSKAYVDANAAGVHYQATSTLTGISTTFKWTEFDYSANVPAGAKYIELALWLSSTNYGNVRPASSTANTATTSANAYGNTGATDYVVYNITVALTANRVVEAWFSSGAERIQVTGYWK